MMNRRELLASLVAAPLVPVTQALAKTESPKLLRVVHEAKMDGTPEGIARINGIVLRRGMALTITGQQAVTDGINRILTPGLKVCSKAKTITIINSESKIAGVPASEWVYRLIVDQELYFSFDPRDATNTVRYLDPRYQFSSTMIHEKDDELIHPSVGLIPGTNIITSVQLQQKRWASYQDARRYFADFLKIVFMPPVKDASDPMEIARSMVSVRVSSPLINYFCCDATGKLTTGSHSLPEGAWLTR